ncbi:Hypothetical predicted protein [Olea europaea subsp. europaea]|uniref:DUF1985 domain-containing protein n=1 Tax=Olea europaea subsp. europaea TaxID=158383 RepID=A0A8S0RYZ0_OLEEU|nr:Hypothetical predicted protein [Olea europaea subsp. europaea]
MEKILQVDATITTRCRLQIVQDVYEKLDTNYRNKLSESCFGSLLRLKDIKLASQVIHQLLLRKLRTNKKEVWFKIGEKNTKFGLEEFILVTGLNAGDENDVDKTLGEECRIVKEYFRNSGGKITKGDAYNAFVICKKRKSDKYKLGLIVILAYVLWATEENTYIDLWWLDLVDDLDRFETYPWGKFSFEYTISIFKREMGDKLKSSDVGGESRCRYSLHGFPLAIMIWAFEAIPTLGMKFGMKYPDVIPRMVAWEMPKRLTSAAIENVLNSKELEVNSTLIPTEAELEEAYWKELKPIVEEDESVSYHSEGDEAEQDAEPQHAYHEESPRAAQPPQRDFEINIEDLLRTEIEKLEGRLQAVISTRLDRVEKKVDRLVELAVAGRFHPATSAFDGATSSTAYVPENEPKDELEKEVGFDDVTDVHAAERKSELTLSDTI